MSFQTYKLSFKSQLEFTGLSLSKELVASYITYKTRSFFDFLGTNFLLVCRFFRRVCGQSLCLVLISDCLRFWLKRLHHLPSVRPVKQTVFISCVVTDIRWVLTVFVLISLSRLFSYDASTSDWRRSGKLIDGRKTSAIITGAQRPGERDPVETDPRQSWRRAAVMESLWQTGAAESFDKSLNATWGPWSPTINQLDGFIQRGEAQSRCCHHQTSPSATNSFICHLSSQNSERAGQMLLLRIFHVLFEKKTVCSSNEKWFGESMFSERSHAVYPSAEPNRCEIYYTLHNHLI